jgi:prepilin-type N-terminal cleavage/methylation domain-containing protein
METRLTNAFTLLEVVLTLAILAIVLSIAIPKFSQYLKDYNMSNQIDKLYSDINYAKFYGTSHHVPVNINISQNQMEALTNDTNSTLIVQDNFSYPMSCSNSLIALNSFGITQGSVNCYIEEQNNANPNCFIVQYSKISTGRLINGICQQ